MTYKDDLLRRMAEDLRSHPHRYHAPGCYQCDLLAEYDAAYPKPEPDAAGRASLRWWVGGYRSFSDRESFATLIREEIARDNAARDAQDKEREEAARDLISVPFPKAWARVCRAFGWEK